MSKWQLLRNTINQKRRLVNNDASIHRFSGHSSFSKSKYLWRGFTMELRLSDLFLMENESQNSDCTMTFYHRCSDYIKIVDCAEIFVDLLSDVSDINVLDTFLMELKTQSSSLRIDFEQQTENNLGIHHKLRVIDSSYEPREKAISFFRYNLAPFHSSAAIFTREPVDNKVITAKDLFSNQIYGIDNTGNICVWPSESLLLYVFLENPRLQQIIRGRRILELGGGITALAGLGLAILGIGSEVLITDGHPSCVSNQQTCIEMCRSMKVFTESSCAIRAMLLNWSNFDSTEVGTWEVVFGADCLFFEDFHDSLIHLLLLVLTADGTAIFFQPKRSGSVERFMVKAKEYFDYELMEEYSVRITDEKRLAETDPTIHYNADIHYPIFLFLKRKGAKEER